MKAQEHSPLWFQAYYLCRDRHGGEVPCCKCMKRTQDEHEKELEDIAANPNY